MMCYKHAEPSIYTVCLFSVSLCLCAILQIGSVFERGHNELLLHGFAMFWVSKLYELLDVVFMILQQQAKRITFINIFYRGTLPLIAYWAYFIDPRPITVPVLAINAAVHTFNYLYYFQPQAVLSGNIKRAHSTQTRNVLLIEILQFFLMSAYGIYSWLYHGVCIYIVVYAAYLLVYYIHYYYSYMQYMKSKQQHAS